ILLDLGKLEESGVIYAELVREQSAPATAWYGLGRVRLAQGTASAALEPLRNACRLYPEFGAAHYSLAQALRSLGRGQEALYHLEQAEIHKAGAPPVEDRLMAEIAELNRGPARLLRAAKTAEEQGRLTEAEVLTLQALELDPKSVQAHTNLISLYGRRGAQEKAAAHYRRVLTLSPNHADAHYNYGVLLFQQENRNEARSAFEKALAANPYLAAAHNNLAYLLEMEGRAEEAMKHYRLALKNEPGYRLAHFHLGRLLAERRQYAQSIEHLRQTLSPEDSNTPGYLYALGDVHRRSGDRIRSTAVLNQAREMAAAMGQTALAATIEKELRELGAR
ncbi:MAG: tetratricopeptide repeat protein, partial [Bryobacteraceae bacterium]